MPKQMPVLYGTHESESEIVQKIDLRLFGVRAFRLFESPTQYPKKQYPKFQSNPIQSNIPKFSPTQYRKIQYPKFQSNPIQSNIPKSSPIHYPKIQSYSMEIKHINVTFNIGTYALITLKMPFELSL
ncbi:hypothetical protein CEXT_393301 [Caerostris extrusa]|uniref:Uncharacterized protein n=1 Tax=Caerostris extrusa TaxID=172846 RepID=A0AAV4NSF9_CAEEX|nr:hypothetical protein CEXT_393301 [Caerostris extrusa]